MTFQQNACARVFNIKAFNEKEKCFLSAIEQNEKEKKRTKLLMDKLVGPFSADISSKGCFPIYVHQIYFIAMAFAASPQSVAV